MRLGGWRSDCSRTLGRGRLGARSLSLEGCRARAMSHGLYAVKARSDESMAARTSTTYLHARLGPTVASLDGTHRRPPCPCCPEVVRREVGHSVRHEVLLVRIALAGWLRSSSSTVHATVPQTAPTAPVSVSEGAPRPCPTRHAMPHDTRPFLNDLAARLTRPSARLTAQGRSRRGRTRRRSPR